MNFNSHEEILNKLSPEIISHFLATGKSQGIPAETQDWLQDIQVAYEVYTNNDPDNEDQKKQGTRNIQKAAKIIKERIAAEFRRDLSLRQCQSRIYSALRYFHVDASVPDKIWNLDFANKYEEIAQKADASSEFKAAIEALKMAHECREKASEAANLEKDMGIVFIISNDIDIINGLGFEKRSLKEIARKHSDGFYHGFINSLPIDSKEKERLRRDAELTEYEEVESD